MPPWGARRPGRPPHPPGPGALQEAGVRPGRPDPSTARQGQVAEEANSHQFGESSENLGEDLQGGFGRRGAGGFGGRSGVGGGDNAGRGGFAERWQNMTPEQREQMLERMRARGIGSGASGIPKAATRQPAQQAKAPAGNSEQSLTARDPRATTIDALFGPLPPVERSAACGST